MVFCVYTTFMNFIIIIIIALAAGITHKFGGISNRAASRSQVGAAGTS